MKTGKSHKMTAGCLVWTCLLALLAAGHAPVPCSAQAEAAGNNPRDEIKIGISAAFSGPTKSLGQHMRLGIETRFARANRNGGIHGRRLRLIWLDDGYEPSEVKKNMLALINTEHALAVVGNIGTPTAKVAVPIANQYKTLLFGALTGASFLRNPANRYVINYRASYAEETAAMIHGLLDNGVRPFEIAFFRQDDSYGKDAYIGGAVKALHARGFRDTEQLAVGSYKRNTSNVKEGVLTVLRAEIKPRAIIMIGTYAPCAKFIRIVRRRLPDALFLNVSFVNSTALAAELGADGEGVVITEVVPHFESKLPVCQEYLRDLKTYLSKEYKKDPYLRNESPGSISLEGYIVASILEQAIRNAGSHLTRETVIDEIEKMNDLEIGLDTPVRFNENLRQLSHDVWPTVIRDGKIVPFYWRELQTLRSGQTGRKKKADQ